MRLAVDGDLALLHRLQQRGLRLRRRAVDLVGEQHVGEHRARAGSAARRSRSAIVPGDVGGQHVGRELEPPELDAERPRGRVRQQRLRDAGHALEQHVTAERERGQDDLERLPLPDHDPPDLAGDPLAELLHRRTSVVR